jgi:hypothetical protein
MYQEIIDLLYHPDIFFERRNKEKIDLVIPAIIVAIGGIVTFLSPLLEVAFTRGGDIGNFGMEPSAAFWFLLLPFALWFLTTGVLHVVCRLLSGTGSFRATLQNCGYGYLPQTVLSPLLVVNGIAVTWFSGMQSIFVQGIMIIPGITLFFGLFWSTALWTVAMEKTHGLSRGKAIIGPVLVFLLSELPLLLVILTDYSPHVPPP